jgi:hypothetical protein
MPLQTKPSFAALGLCIAIFATVAADDAVAPDAGGVASDNQPDNAPNQGVLGECASQEGDECQSCGGHGVVPAMSYCVNKSVCQNVTILSLASAEMSEGSTIVVRYVTECTSNGHARSSRVLLQEGCHCTCAFLSWLLCVPGWI